MKILTAILVSVLYVLFYFLFFYMSFDDCLSKDVDYRFGKSRLKKRKKVKSFWRKFLFLDIKYEVIKWHYFLFFVNLVSFVFFLLFINLTLLFEAPIFRELMRVFLIILFVSVTPIAFSRYVFNKANIFRDINERRKKERLSKKEKEKLKKRTKNG